MAQAAKKTETQTAAPTGKFVVSDDMPVPLRNKEIPDYGIEAVFAGMAKGANVLIKFEDIPLEHARTLVQRFARTGGPKGKNGKPTPVDMVTKSEKHPDTGEFYALRVWRNS